jgi:hypothetical protein
MGLHCLDYLISLMLLSKETISRKEKEEEKQQYIAVGTLRMLIEPSAKH